MDCSIILTGKQGEIKCGLSAGDNYVLGMANCCAVYRNALGHDHNNFHNLGLFLAISSLIILIQLSA